MKRQPGWGVGKFVMALSFMGLSLMAVSGPGSAENAETDKQKSEWLTLGTVAGPIPHATRSQPANALVVGDDVYLVDAGDGAAGRLAAAGLSISAIRAVFISHLHFDHTGGLPGIIALRWQANSPEPITVYGPPGIKQTMEGIFAFMAHGAEGFFGVPGRKPKPANYNVNVVELRDESIVELDDFTLTAIRNTHYSWPEGSEEWEKFQSLAFKFELSERTIVFTGDTGPSAAVEKLARKADLLISEMLDIEDAVTMMKKQNPNQTQEQLDGVRQHLADHHVTPEQVGQMASRADVKKVVVTHMRPALTDASEIEHYINIIKSRFDGEVEIANDLDRF